MIYFGYLSFLYCALLIWLDRRIKAREVDPQIAWTLAFLVMILGFLGSRLMHIIYERPDVYLANPWQALRFWEGGYVYFGGALLSALGCWIYLKSRKESFLFWADFMAPIFALGSALGRGACLIAGCCYGRYCDLPWAINGKHPTPLYFMVTEVCVFLLLVHLQKKSDRFLGMIFGVWLVGHSLGRLFMEHYRDDFRGQFLWGQSISTWIAWMALACGLCVLYLEKRPQQK